jgi:very-short-patch-repair endonuclease
MREWEPTTATLVTGQKPAAKDERARQMRREPTTAEAKLWYHLRARRLDGLHFRRQQVMDGFIADFYCHALGLVVEVDGGVHQTQTQYDAERDRILQARGLRLLRFSNAEVLSDCPHVLARIRAVRSLILEESPPSVPSESSL